MVGRLVKVAVDTDVLVRALVMDDAEQASAAAQLLKNAALIAVAVPCICELAWVLRKVYAFDHQAVGDAVRALLAAGNVELNRPAVEAGLSVLDAGGDFADGAIAYEGHWLGGETFVSFDRKAVALLNAQKMQARLL